MGTFATLLSGKSLRGEILELDRRFKFGVCV